MEQMTALVIIVFAAAIIYLLMSAVVYYSLSNLREDTIQSNKKSGISIIVAAKNEAANLPVLLNSIRKLDYPKEYFEIIIVNDFSSDKTFDVATSFNALLTNLRVINSQPHKSLSGKKAALREGVKASKFDNIAITDADCEVPPKWLTLINSYLSKKDLVIGIAPLSEEANLIDRIALYENLKAHLHGFASANIGIPYTAAARNFAYKKKVINSIGGYEAVNETVGGDDDLLLREAVKNRFKIGLMIDRNSFVFSRIRHNFTDYFRQKARHTSTSHYYSSRVKFILAAWHLSGMICFFSFLLSLLSSIFVLPIILKFLVDYLIANSFQNKFGYNFAPHETALLNLVYDPLLVIHFINSFRFKKRWR